jgi:hypothetical protein
VRTHVPTSSVSNAIILSTRLAVAVPRDASPLGGLCNDNRHDEKARTDQCQPESTFRRFAPASCGSVVCNSPGSESPGLAHSKRRTTAALYRNVNAACTHRRGASWHCLVQIELPAGNKRMRLAPGITRGSLRRRRAAKVLLESRLQPEKGPPEGGTPANLDWQRQCYAVLNHASNSAARDAV